MRARIYLLFVILATSLFISCNESSFLKETPLDFFSPENSLETKEQFQSSLNHLYSKVRDNHWNINEEARYTYFYATDLCFNAAEYYVPSKLNDYTNVMTPTFFIPALIWEQYYKVIFNANVIIDRLPQSKSITDDDKNLIKGEALFFRAYTYNLLANLFGGVPLNLNEITVPHRDFVRASREEVYSQVQADLNEAIKYLADIENVKDGKVSKQVAQHLLVEACISLKKYDEAINAASAVINHPTMQLMTERFGSEANQEGDVYADLFRPGNLNRQSGNKESLWVFQFDYLNPASSVNDKRARGVIPFYQNIQITAEDEAGEAIKTTAFLGVTDMKGGRGIGWMQPTSYFFNELWGNDYDNDLRNSNFNIIKDFRIDNPASPAFGKWLVKDGYAEQIDPIRYWYPLITKFSSIGKVPEQLYAKDTNGEPVMTEFGEHLLLNSAECSYKDAYVYRLAETYLLRAEAYLGAGDKEKAASDINALRDRAKATRVNAGQVDLDLILDERLKELYFEEFRMVTLTRMGKLVDRNRRYNPKTGPTISDHHNLWPVPYAEIERNVYSELTQNPGYK